MNSFLTFTKQHVNKKKAIKSKSGLSNLCQPKLEKTWYFLPNIRKNFNWFLMFDWVKYMNVWRK